MRYHDELRALMLLLGVDKIKVGGPGQWYLHPTPPPPLSTRHPHTHTHGTCYPRRIPHTHGTPQPGPPPVGHTISKDTYGNITPKAEYFVPWAQCSMFWQVRLSQTYLILYVNTHTLTRSSHPCLATVHLRLTFPRTVFTYEGHTTGRQ